MTRGLLFWILMVLWAVFGIVGFFQPYPGHWSLVGHQVFLFVLFVLLGWKVYGSPVQG